MHQRAPLGPRMTRSYVAVLAAICAISLLETFLTEQSLSQQKRIAEVLQRAGEQRVMLRDAEALIHDLTAPAAEDRARAHVRITGLLHDLRQTHHLKLGTRTALGFEQVDPVSRGVPPALTDPHVASMIAEAEALADQALTGRPDQASLGRLQAILVQGLPARIDQAALLYGRRAERQIASLTWLERGLTLATIGILLIIAARIIWPMIRHVERSTAALEIANRRLEHGALHDSLTTLPNRRYLGEHLGRLLANARRNGHSVGLLHLDLDRFKAVNDTHGHAAGDHVLVEASRIMFETVRTGDFLARIGGDEFVIVSPEQSTVEGLGVLARRLITRLADPIRSPGTNAECRVGVSIGIAIAAPGEGIDPDGLMLRADRALYAAKKEGRGCYRIDPASLAAGHACTARPPAPAPAETAAISEI